ncbi:MAG: hypothetical protein U9N49_01090, partial [Campylobacterota bacterium]|nr:hypothetical protein [Campylobacterota bacterium]
MKSRVLKISDFGLIHIFMLLIIIFIMFSCGGGAGSNDNLENKNSNYKPSFGIHPSSENRYAYAKDLGIDFNREGAYFIWDWIDTDKNGSLSFKNASIPPKDNKLVTHMNYDNERQRLLDVEDITLMNNVCPFNSRDQLKNEFKDEAEKEIYKSFIEKLVERYDGDDDLGCSITNGVDCYNVGDNEYPSQELI